MPEARLEDVGSGLAPVTEGWFVVNARDAAWLNNDYFGGVCIFESDELVLRLRPDAEPVENERAGFTLRVVRPGQPAGLYHEESKQQEDFLVLAGECVLLIDGQERRLQPWDVVRCPPGTPHTFVGTGSEPCVILGAGNRDASSTIFRPRSELALRHRAGVEEETTSYPHDRYGPWKHEHPESWEHLPWNVPRRSRRG
jgi:uncharacterized cupin superfamily protein